MNDVYYIPYSLSAWTTLPRRHDHPDWRAIAEVRSPGLPIGDWPEIAILREMIDDQDAPVYRDFGDRTTIRVGIIPTRESHLYGITYVLEGAAADHVALRVALHRQPHALTVQVADGLPFMVGGDEPYDAGRIPPVAIQADPLPFDGSDDIDRAARDMVR